MAGYTLSILSIFTLARLPLPATLSYIFKPSTSFLCAIRFYLQFVSFELHVAHHSVVLSHDCLRRIPTFLILRFITPSLVSRKTTTLVPRGYTRPGRILFPRRILGRSIYILGAAT